MADRIATAAIVHTDNVWENKHENVTQAYKRYYTINRPQPQDGALIVEDMRACATAIQGIFGEAIAAGERLRCIGGGWSLSNAAVTDGWLLDTQSMNLYWTMEQRQMDPGYAGEMASLYLAQCGMSVQELNETVEGDGRALATSGASNGQTIVGAIATGTHGSAFQYGSMPEYVVGIYLITDPGKTIWLERASYPVVSAAFAAELGAELQRDDQLFNAALVSFGSCGIIAGVMVETVPIYTLECKRFMLDLNDDLRDAMCSMNFDKLNLNPTNELPWHFEVTFNPHDTTQGYARTMYKRAYPTNPPYKSPVLANGELGPGEGLLSVVSTITSLVSATNVAAVMKILVDKNLKPTDPTLPVVLTTPRDTFPVTLLRGQAMSMELGIAMEDSARVLDLILGLHPEIDVYAGVISFRWVKQTTAMLGWTKFPTTATIEFNAAHNDRTLDFYNRIWNELQSNGIPYTLHWGQMNNFTPAMVSAMYGTAVTDWLSCRNTLLTPAAQSVFASAFMTSTGLG